MRSYSRHGPATTNQLRLRGAPFAVLSKDPTRAIDVWDTSRSRGSPRPKKVLQASATVNSGHFAGILAKFGPLRDALAGKDGSW